MVLTEEPPSDGARRGPGLGSGIGLLFAAWGAVIASFPLDDNSFFTHVATGRLILDRGSVPSTDPYTFTAAGEPWTVQSWLMSLAYAGAERLGGAFGLRVLVTAIVLVATALLWRLSRAATSVFVRIGIMAGAMTAATTLWTPRPYMVGVIGLGILWLVLEEQWSPYWVVPLLWLWANSHGSFPLAGALVVAVLVGRLADGDAVDHAARVLAATAGGIALAAVGPLGPKLWWFPLRSLTRSEVFAEVVEWRAPTFQHAYDRAYLVLLVVTVLALIRTRRWAHAIPAVLFGAAGIVAVRNVVLAVMVLVPVASSSVGSVGRLRTDDRSPVGRALAVVGSVVAILTLGLAVLSPVDAVSAGPDRALAWASTAGIDYRSIRTVVDPPTGNLLEVLDGATGSVFADDRFDMLPADVFADLVTIERGRAGWDEVLDRRDIDVVLWATGEELSQLLRVDDRFRTVYVDQAWSVFCRRMSAACPSEG